MPFDFCRYQHYKVDYESLFHELNTRKILNNKRIQTELLGLWMEGLKRADQELSDLLKTINSIKALRILHQSEPEIFQLPLRLRNNQILLHFRVSFINKIITEDDRKNAEYLPLDAFDKILGVLNWTPVEGAVKLYSGSKAPILLVPFLGGQHNRIVIDGNHRLTSKRKENRDDVRGLLIAEQSVIENHLTASSFDELYYIMNNELVRMANETHFQQTEASKLIYHSYLNRNLS